MKTKPTFTDGSAVPDDEVLFDPDVDQHYGAASRDRIKALKERVDAVKRKTQEGGAPKGC
jgi:hypothetical protein